MYRPNSVLPGMRECGDGPGDDIGGDFLLISLVFSSLVYRLNALQSVMQIADEDGRYGGVRRVFPTLS